MINPKTIAKIEHQVRKYETARAIVRRYSEANTNTVQYTVCRDGIWDPYNYREYVDFSSANKAVSDARTAMKRAFFRFKSICPPDKVDEYVNSGRIDEKISVITTFEKVIMIPQVHHEIVTMTYSSRERGANREPEATYRWIGRPPEIEKIIRSKR